MFITSKEMRRIELNSRWLGFEEDFMMENAGAGVARVVIGEYSPNDVLVVCGTGGNGGDGFVTARHLDSEGVDVDVLLVGRREAIKNEAAELNLRRLDRAGIPVQEVRDSEDLESVDFERDVVVDALLGFGIRGRLREPVRSAVLRINEASRAGTRVVSIDIPTGLDPDSGETPDVAVEADLVVSIHRHKRGVRKLRDVFLRRVNAGIPEIAERICGPGDLITSDIWRRDPWSHKGQHGRVLIIGGSRKYVGAPQLAARGALRAGVDLVFLLTVDAVPKNDPNVIYRAVPAERLEPEHLDEVDLEGVDTVVVGPGLGADADSVGILRELAESFDGMIIVDADGLRGISGVNVDDRFVLTPHAGEFRREFGEELGRSLEDRSEAVRRVSEELGCTILLKGRVDVIGSPDGEIRWNVTGTPAMTVGGTGDVLAGVVAGVAARCREGFEAACIGAFVVGSAGCLAERRLSQGLTAEDVAEYVPKVLRNPWAAEPEAVTEVRRD
ncbi:NAD(P)H-hydrate dehydratase [Methanopyrus kandleri]|uniref:Bifunctional NAD(P)H-hydrate repair enzyme Nnr n=2 Tax=Methanopyrus kandleri TaxID=2320 RepID=NNR_METKA|nr:NAD(P)H-hydrate dehydratase [Methanopyrus kandleri]Q8TX67.1 RecName: Full=Bifunctional NAD(P)H-hydrate repair enzyme Nnr; AltName: Full=Nicotinamide nucleotide repair protein; Includes: RecName: Full=ADP-dependent (S)-NAD(P)H-hydrate dehydratase; AltName: Full=ADP-dependent NAD(P)HX dehydratase; Includes: RecName: Full=NAD(P)H-hydrate epimerase; AltName: Full=NAD(P)HX epimerase [Methanopyrus kandleri AV19]AAM02022.1 Short chain dehydrogenase fused to sugar kinase [Methanopyrus kandleri AV19]H